MRVVDVARSVLRHGTECHTVSRGTALSAQPGARPSAAEVLSLIGHMVEADGAKLLP
jgi:hypothetical protein